MDILDDVNYQQKFFQMCIVVRCTFI